MDALLTREQLPRLDRVPYAITLPAPAPPTTTADSDSSPPCTPERSGVGGGGEGVFVSTPERALLTPFHTPMAPTPKTPAAAACDDILLVVASPATIRHCTAEAAVSDENYGNGMASLSPFCVAEFEALLDERGRFPALEEVAIATFGRGCAAK